MAAAMSSATMAAAVVPSLAVASTSTTTRSSSSFSKLGMRKLQSFGGLKPESQVTRMGVSQSTEEAFAGVRARWSAGAARGGALAVSCNVAEEIFKIIPIMSGLTLVGIALGFVLLRVEAAVEESE